MCVVGRSDGDDDNGDMIDDDGYGLNCVPQNSHAKVPRTLDGTYLEKWSLKR